MENEHIVHIAKAKLLLRLMTNLTSKELQISGSFTSRKTKFNISLKTDGYNLGIRPLVELIHSGH